MIDYIAGALVELLPTVATVEVHGIGYEVNISLNTFDAIQGKAEVQLYIDEQWVIGSHDDGVTLYGFATKEERELYRLLRTVNGVGASTARMVLSSMSEAELCRAIGEGDERLLKSVKGIGPKAAQRIILELKDKIIGSGLSDKLVAGGGLESVPALNKEVRDEAVGALTMLGFATAPTAKVVSELLRNEPTLTVEEVVKKALKMM